MEEIWKDIEGYEGLYHVSNLGNVRSLDRIVNRGSGKGLHKGRVLKPNILNSGYYIVALSKNGEIKKYLVHRLVAEAYLENENNLPCVNHINELKTDNRVENLEWCSYLYNNEYSGIYEKAAKAVKEKKSYLNAHNARKKPVLQFTKDGQFVSEYKSGADAERKTGICQSKINECCTGKHKSAKGYIFRYKEKTP